MEPKSLIQIISEEEFLPLIQELCPPFFRAFNSFHWKIKNKIDINRKFYSRLIQDAELLESFLDEHGARENRKWNPFTEFVASIRNLVISAFLIKHLLDRFPNYNLLEKEEDDLKFKEEAQKTLEFLNRSVQNLYEEVLKTAYANGLQVTTDKEDQNDSAEIETDKRLPINIEEDQVKDEEERILDICHKFHNLAQTILDYKIEKTHDLENLKNLIPSKIDERKARYFKNQVHSVQSDYDTYVKNTRLEQEHPKLKNFRGYISMPLHLLEVVLWLTHFYERHEDEIRFTECKKKISTLVSKNQLLERVVNFGLYFALFYIESGDKLSEELLKTFEITVKYELPLPQPLGLHARPSTYISLIVRQYEGEAFLWIDDEKFNAKSVMNLLQAGGALADKGYTSVVFEGDKRVLDDIRVLAENNYCEDQPIPKELQYLKKSQKKTA